ncbi:hypothetical protein WDU94_000488 [Cyamophila willieti]
MATSELSRGKTIFVLTVVAGCFAVLWPKIFYPMFFGSPQYQNNVEKAHGGPQLNGCCDVIFEKDIQTLKIITQLCEENVLLNTITNSSRPLSKPAMLNLCYQQLQETCNIDLSNLFKMNQRHELDSTFKEFIGIVRSFNSSLCLKYHYNVNFNLLGTPRMINSNVMKPTSLINAKKNEKQTNGVKSQLRQERPPHMRPEMMHPALRENGRAIPHEHIVPRVEPEPAPRPVMKQPGGPKPGMGRPAFGGGGPHAAKQGGGGIMNLLMPMYTISIVAFFIYTMLRIWDPMVMFVKLVLQFVSNSSNNARDRNASSTDYYSSSTTELRSTSYYPDEYCATGKKQLPEPASGKPATEQEKPGSKLEDLEMESLRRRLEATEAAMERLVTQMLTTPARVMGTLPSVTMATVQDAPLAEDKLNTDSSSVNKTDSSASGVTSKTPTAPGADSRQNSILEVEINDYEDVKQVFDKQKAKDEALEKEKNEKPKENWKEEVKEFEKKGVKFEDNTEDFVMKEKEKDGVEEQQVDGKKKVNFEIQLRDKDQDKVPEEKTEKAQDGIQEPEVDGKKKVNFEIQLGDKDQDKVREEKIYQRNVRFIEEEKAQESNNVLDKKLDEETVNEVKKIIEEEIVQRAIEEVNRGLENRHFGVEVAEKDVERTNSTEIATKPFELVTNVGGIGTPPAVVKSDEELIKENIEKISEELQKTIISSEHERPSGDFVHGTKLNEGKENGHDEVTENGHQSEKDLGRRHSTEREFAHAHEKKSPHASEDRVNASAVQVIGMDRTESLVGGQKWDLGRRSPPPRSITPEFRPVTPEIPPPAAHRIVLDGLVLPAGADKIMVTETETESEATSGGESDSDSVVLSSKVTLSLLPGGVGGAAEQQVDGGSEGEEELNVKTNGTLSTASTTSTGPVKPSSLNLKDTSTKSTKNNYDGLETDVESSDDNEEEEEDEEDRKPIAQLALSKGQTNQTHVVGLKNGAANIVKNDTIKENTNKTSEPKGDKDFRRTNKEEEDEEEEDVELESEDEQELEEIEVDNEDLEDEEEEEEVEEVEYEEEGGRGRWRRKCR